jgi:uncharacterized protein
MADIVEKIREFVEEESRKPTSHYGYDPYRFHFTAVVDYAGKLADELEADKEIVLLAAWLHDIGSIMVGRDEHHLTGAEIAERKLLELGYPEDRTAWVRDCILSHRGSRDIGPNTLEAQILIEADTLSAFNDITGLFQCALVYEKLPRLEAKNSVRQKLINKYNQLKFEDSKKIVEPKYKAAMLLLE